MATVLSVAHQHNAGWHTFTSMQLPGLFLTGPDDQYAALREALVSTIAALIAAERGRSSDALRLDVSQVPSFKRFRAGKNDEPVLHFVVNGLD